MSHFDVSVLSSVAQVSSVSPLLLPTSGQVLLSLFGNNFGVLSSLRVAVVGVSSCSPIFYTSDSSISCTTAQGWGMLQLGIVSVDGVQGVSSMRINFTGKFDRASSH
jgi:hypothetical protein